MDYKYIEQLIDRYFDGTTTVAEERILKAFFSQNDVPAHLQRYAAVFDYEDSQLLETPLGEDFDQRVFARLSADGDAPCNRVKIQRMTFADRFRPLGRAAAAVAIIALLGGSIHRAYVTHPVEPINQFGYGQDEAGQTNAVDNREFTTTPFIQEGEKVAITTDTLGATSKVE